MGNAFAENDSKGLDLVLEKLYRDRGYDFRGYKHGTITRRLARRLHATRTITYLEYMQFLDSHPEEYERLIDYLTIPVQFLQKPLHLSAGSRCGTTRIDSL